MVSVTMIYSKAQLLFILIPCFTLLSCGHNEGPTKQLTQDKAATRALLEKTATVTLPLCIKGCSIPTQNLPLLNEVDFVTEEGEKHIYGKFQLSNGYTALVILANADCEIPVIITFDKDGNKIDEKEVHIGRCATECGYTCNEVLHIDPAYNIYTADTISYFTCDSLGNAIAGTDEHYVLYKQGRIVKTGIIELSQEKRRQL